MMMMMLFRGFKPAKTTVLNIVFVYGNIRIIGGTP